MRTHRRSKKSKEKEYETPTSVQQRRSEGRREKVGTPLMRPGAATGHVEIECWEGTGKNKGVGTKRAEGERKKSNRRGFKKGSQPFNRTRGGPSKKHGQTLAHYAKRIWFECTRGSGKER